jgi:hypothetical protein
MIELRNIKPGYLSTNVVSYTIVLNDRIFIIYYKQTNDAAV